MSDDEFPLDRPDQERYLVALLLSVTLRSLRDEALNRVAAEDFGSGNYAGLWQAALSLRASNRPIDRRNLIAEAGGEAGPSQKLIEAREKHVAHLLDTLDGYLPTAHEFPRVVQDVTTTGKLRRLVESLKRGIQRAYSAEDFGQAYTAARDELEKLADTDDDTAAVQQMDAVIHSLEVSFKSGLSARVIPSPWPDFNEKGAGGFHAGRLYVIGARPGHGKSIAGHQAAAFAAEHGQPAMVFSLEMGALEVGGRMFASGARVDMHEVARSELSDDSWQRFHEFADRSRGWPLWVVDKPAVTLEYIKSVCRTQKRRHGLDLVCVDYLQLLNLARMASREQQVAEIARQFKILSRELDCAVILPAQLNRETERRGKPSLGDLRESGGIEAHADMVILLARQRFAEGHGAAGDYTGDVSLDIAKNRFGPTGSFELPWRGCYASIG